MKSATAATPFRPSPLEAPFRSGLHPAAPRPDTSSTKHSGRNQSDYSKSVDEQRKEIEDALHPWSGPAQ